MVFMNRMFEKSRFQGDISQWDTSKVQDMRFMFSNSRFQGNISKWDVSNVEKMSYMFMASIFQGDISQWNTSKVVSMAGMFSSSMFNGDISQWDVSRVDNIYRMFSESTFQGDVSSWDLASLTLFGKGNAFSRFHDSPLGYLTILSGAVSFPQNDPRAAQFETLRSICEGLNMDPLSTAQYIYQQTHQPFVVIDLSTMVELP